MRGTLRLSTGVLTLACAFACLFGSASATAAPTRGGLTVVGYTSEDALRAALAESGARLVRKLPQLHAAEVRTAPAALDALQSLRGIRYAHRPVTRTSLVEPGLATAPVMGGAYEWQFAASREDRVPASVMQAASALTVAVVDTGADVSAPDLAAKRPATWSVLHGSTDVTDLHGHGTFVSSLAVGSATNGEGIAGFGGDAKLLVVQAGAPDGSFTDVDEAAGITYAVDHGARIVNLSFGGTSTSPTEQAAIDYAVAHGVLLVAAAGNDGDGANLPLYPAALLQPVGSNGQRGVGLAVGASTIGGARASFSNFGSYISLAAPGQQVLGDVSSQADPSDWFIQRLPGSTGLYGYGSGTSFASPEVAGAAALVWAAKPSLTAQEVAQIIKQSASGAGSWNAQTGYGLLDVAAAVARAQGASVGPAPVSLTVAELGTHVKLAWSSPGALSYKLSVRKDKGPAQVVGSASAATSADYDLEPGHAYSFSVYAVDGYGRSGVSAPIVLRAPAASSKRLARIRVWAFVAPENAATAGQAISLQSYDGFTWHRLAQSTTTPTGVAMFTVKLRRGAYKLRAVSDFAANVSAPVQIRVR